MERLTRKNGSGGYELLEGISVEAAVERLAGYENTYGFLLGELEKAEQVKVQILRVEA